MPEYHLAIRPRQHLIRRCVDDGRRLPMFEVKRITFFEENGELSTLRPEPKTILTAKGVDVQTGLAGRDKVVVDQTWLGLPAAPTVLVITRP